MTSPRVNAVIIAGASIFFVYLGLYNVPIDADMCTAESMDFLNSEGPDLDCSRDPGNACCDALTFRSCYTKSWLLPSGVTLALVTLIGKTQRVNALFNAKSLFVHAVPDSLIMKKTLLSFGVLIVYLLLWMFVSPVTVHFAMSSEVLDGPNQVLQRKLLPVCSSQYEVTFNLLLAAALYMCLFYGGYAAFQIRNVQLKQVNDSKQIRFSIYNIFVLGTLSAVLAEIVKDSPNELFYIISTLTFMCGSGTLCILFLPSVIDIRAGKTNLAFEDETAR